MSEGAGSPVVVIGAGVGGLAAAIALAAEGHAVELLEAGDAPGGKMRPVETGGRSYDAGPTVLTMKWVFDDLLARCGTTLEDGLPLARADLLARHYWPDGSALDLAADPQASAEAIAAFAGPREAEGFRRFARDSARVHDLLRTTFIDAPRPNPVSLSHRIGFARPAALLALRPFTRLWSALGDYFADPRLRQLFGRYATYCGSSPFLAPATLMLVAHVEQAGVWIPQGGMRALAARLAAVAVGLGVDLRYGERVTALRADGDGRSVAAVVTATGRVIAARRVIYAGDVAALGRLLRPPSGAPSSAPSTASSAWAAARRRSLSALVACGPAEPQGVPLAHHTVFFSGDCRGEFDALFAAGRAPVDPTVYVCAQDRAADGTRAAAEGPERLYLLMNLPADGDRGTYGDSEVEQCLQAIGRRLAASGLRVDLDRSHLAIRTPRDFEALYPATGGALYGQASHGWRASFTRPGARGPLAGLYLAGGSVHPGPGVPMAALSGRLAARTLMADLASTGRSRPVAITGGISTPRATAGSSPAR